MNEIHPTGPGVLAELRVEMLEGADGMGDREYVRMVLRGQGGVLEGEMAFDVDALPAVGALPLPALCSMLMVLLSEVQLRELRNHYEYQAAAFESRRS